MMKRFSSDNMTMHVHRLMVGLVLEIHSRLQRWKARSQVYVVAARTTATYDNPTSNLIETRPCRLMLLLLLLLHGQTIHFRIDKHAAKAAKELKRWLNKPEE